MQQRSVERLQLPPGWPFGLVDRQARGNERRLRLWVWNPFARRRVGELRKRLEFLAAAFGDQPTELRVMVSEVLKGSRSREFLAHEQHRGARQKQQQRRGVREAIQVDLLVQPLAEGTIAHLVVVLQRVDELPGRSIPGGRAALLFEPAARRPLAFIQPALFDAARHLVEGADVVGVVALVVARQVAAQAVVKIVCPHRVEAEATPVDRFQVPNVVLARLGNEHGLTPGR